MKIQDNVTQGEDEDEEATRSHTSRMVPCLVYIYTSLLLPILDCMMLSYLLFDMNPPCAKLLVYGDTMF